MTAEYRSHPNRSCIGRELASVIVPIFADELRRERPRELFLQDQRFLLISRMGCPMAPLCGPDPSQ